MREGLKRTARKVIHLLANYRDLCDVYYLKSSWLTNATAAGMLAQYAVWEELATSKIDLDRAIEMLTERQRLVIARRFILQETLEEIARALGVDGATVHRDIKRAIRYMAETLGEDW